MIKKVVFASLIIFVPFISYAANILLWHFDPLNLDHDPDPEAGMDIYSDYWLKESFKSIGVAYDYHDDTLLPADINSYDVVFANLGWMVC